MDRTAPALPPAAAPSAVPWHALVVVFGGTSIIVGALWDISWHSTVGRDTFWTPAHMAIYLGGLCGGLAGGWAALRATLGGDPTRREAAVSICGLRAPLGAWVAMWGAAAMLTSAPFDDWWHNAYGLDVEILSPPHTVLALGVFGIGLGGLLLATSWQNGAPAARRRTAALVCAWAIGILLAMLATFLTDYSYPNWQHTGRFYRASSIAYPLFLVVAARTVKLRWPATTVAAGYMAVQILMGWILPLFPAQPLLAPIRNPIDHLVPPPFPLVLVAPALVIDQVLRSYREGTGWRGEARAALFAAAAATGFLGVFLAVQWAFSGFLLSDAADNHLLFGARFFAYFNEPGDWMREHWGTRSDPLDAGGIAVAYLFAFISARVGLAFGGWLSRVAR
jgi:hypothetical protein